MQDSRFGRYAWFVTAYNVLVILWGAVVRATGSGAGCGNHWPTCNGEVLPRPEQVETTIEFIHRLTSALAGVFVLILVFWAYCIYAKKSFGRRMALAGLLFVLIEGGIGAALVRFDLVAGNMSSIRAVVVALHLTNTLLLLASLALAAWWASGNTQVRFSPQRNVGWRLAIGLAGLVLLSAAGAVTALGDTLFPPETFSQGLAQDLDPTASFLIRLRVIHPLLAVLVSFFLLASARTLQAARPEPHVRRLVRLLQAIIGLQLAGGALNVLLLAPVWMQIAHLMLADLLWLVLVVLSAELMAIPDTISRE